MNSHDIPGPEAAAARFVAAMNSGGSLDHVYEDDAVLVPVPGHPVTGAARAAAHRHLQSFGVPMEAVPRQVYVAGDIALLIVDWSMRSTARDGTEIDMSGTATDVLRKGQDGRWRYVIDNPHGIAIPHVTDDPQGTAIPHVTAIPHYTDDPRGTATPPS